MVRPSFSETINKVFGLEITLFYIHLFSYYWDRNIQGSKDTNDWKGPPSESSGSPKVGLIHVLIFCSAVGYSQ